MQNLIIKGSAISPRLLAPAAATPPAPSTEDSTPAQPADTASIQHRRKVRFAIFGGAALAVAGATGVAAGACASALPSVVSAPIQSILAPVRRAFDNTSIGKKVESALNRVDRPNAHPDPRSAFGQLYLMTPTGPEAPFRILKQGGQTSPMGNDVPPEAVVNNRVVIAAEGITRQVSDYASGWEQTMDHDSPSTVNLGQPMIGVHEGTGANLASDLDRMNFDFLALKLDQGEGIADAHIIFSKDPAVKTLHDIFRQQLDQGHDVLLLAHSGGATESALALNILSHEQGAHYRDLIDERVRVVVLAGASSAQDFVDSGVQSQNVFYSGDHRDAVSQFGHLYIDPHHPSLALVQDASVLHQALGDAKSWGGYHSPVDVLADNVINGHQVVGDFIKGGPGGTFIR